jgi:hypothetical protein
VKKKRFGNATLEKIGHLGDKWFVTENRKGRYGDLLLGYKKINDSSLYPFSVQRTTKPTEQSKSYF